MKIILSLTAFFISLTQAQEFHYQRQYKDGEKYGYKLSATTTVNGNFRSEETGISSHVVSAAGTPTEEVSWISLRSKTQGGDTNLDEDAKKVRPYRISLHPNGTILLPKLEVPSMTGMLTDLNTFFVAISPKVGIEKVARIGETYVTPSPLYGDWSNAATTPLGQDCTQLNITLLALSAELVTIQSDFLPPPENKLKFKKDWMIPAVTPGISNNFQMLKRNPDGKLSALWGNERYTVITEINRSNGRILSATMENDLALEMRNGCDLDLSGCGAEFPVIMHRDLLLESVEQKRPASEPWGR